MLGVGSLEVEFELDGLCISTLANVPSRRPTLRSLISLVDVLFSPRP